MFFTTSSRGVDVLPYRWTFIEPVLALNYFNGDQAAQDPLSVRGGLDFWIRKHGASIKTEFGGTKTPDLSSARWIKTFTTQTQMFFQAPVPALRIRL